MCIRDRGSGGRRTAGPCDAGPPRARARRPISRAYHHTFTNPPPRPRTHEGAPAREPWVLPLLPASPGPCPPDHHRVRPARHPRARDPKYEHSPPAPTSPTHPRYQLARAPKSAHSPPAPTSPTHPRHHRPTVSSHERQHARGPPPERQHQHRHPPHGRRRRSPERGADDLRPGSKGPTGEGAAGGPRARAQTPPRASFAAIQRR